MFQTNRRGSVARQQAVAMIAIGIMSTSCNREDERLAEYARHSIDQQAHQNEQIARQNEAVAQQGRHLAEGAQHLVEADARARQELIEAQRQLSSELQAERAAVDRHRAELEQERRRLADARQRDPIVAAALQSLGSTLACLLPLLVCAYALRQLSRRHEAETALSELLVQDFVADEPLLAQVRAATAVAVNTSPEQLLPPANRDA